MASELDRILGEREYLVAFCPFHEDGGRPNFVIYRRKGICFRCGREAGPEEVLALFRSGSLRIVERGGGGRSRERDRIEDLESLVREAFENLWRGISRPRQAYLRDRGLALGFAQSKGIGHTGAAFLIPIRGPEGELLGAKLRSDPDLGLSWRYKNWPGTPSTVFRPFPSGAPTVIVEGELDALLLAQWGIDAIAPSTGAWSLLSLPLPTKRRVFLLLDWDEVGREVGRRLEKKGKGILVPEPFDWEGEKDIGEYLSRKPEEKRYDALLALLHRSALESPVPRES